jgi:hypothetical protein
MTDELRTPTENDFRYCHNQWKERWNHCVVSQGSYFEGDNLCLCQECLFNLQLSPENLLPYNGS